MPETKIVLETTMIQEIPVLTLARETAVSRPVIFFIPGYGGTKEAGLRLGTQLAQQGFFFVSFDPWLHGTRYDERLHRAAAPEFGGIYPPETGLDIGILFFQVIERCLTDVKTLLAHLAAAERADVTRCGVTGLSMGGYASFFIFAHLRQMQAAVPMIALPHFSRRWQDLCDETAYSNPAWGAALAGLAEQMRRHVAFVQRIDPYEKLQEAPPRALLIMNCDFDTDQPKLYALDAYRALRPAYAACPDHLRLRIYPAGHTVTHEMEQDAAAWFRQHLQD